MTRERLEQLLSGFAHAHIAVVGDFFLDEYLEIAPELSEVSLETGLEARQVVAVRRQPGAAGNVVANLSALGAGRVQCLGIIGDDGEGFELARALGRLGANTEGLLVGEARLTPTYTKPTLRQPGGGLRELERLDRKNRTPASPELEGELLARLRSAAASADAVIAVDQVQEPECGSVTSRVRAELSELLRGHPKVIGFADSRLRIAGFRGLIVKPNRREACAAVHPGVSGHLGEQAIACGRELAQRVRGPVLLTLGDEGIAVVTQESSHRVPTASLSGELDTVGAGDSVTAGAVLALCAGAGLAEAAVVANLVASITVQQVATTGVATPDQVRRRFSQFEDLWREPA